MKLAALVIVLYVAHARPAETCSRLPPCAPVVAFATADEAATNLASKDIPTLARAIYTLAASDKPAHLQAIGRLLLQPASVDSIMKAPDGMRCLMSSILSRLAANPKARGEFVAVIRSKTWAEDPNRSDGNDRPQALLHASSAMRPPAPELVALWKRFAQPNDGWVNVTVMALAANGSADAIALFENLLRDPRHDLDTRVSWLRSDYLAHRDQLPMLQMARRLFAKPPPGLWADLAETTFDYRQIWWKTCGGPPNPPIAKYSRDARKELRAIAAAVRGGKPDKAIADAVAKTLVELDQVDAAKP